MTPDFQLAKMLRDFTLAIKGATREEVKGAEAPPLAKSELRKKTKYRIVLIFFELQ